MENTGGALCFGILFWVTVICVSNFLEVCMHARFTVTISSVEPNISQFD